MSAVDDIKARLDIVAYVGQFVQLKKAGRHYKGLCPFHSEKSPSFMVDPIRQTWHCYGACAVGGDVIAFAQRRNNWSFGEALQELGKQVGVEVKRQTSAEKQAAFHAEKLYGLLAAAVEVYHRCLLEWNGAADVRTYIETKRQLNPATVQHFQLGYAPSGYQTLLNHLKKQGYTEAEILAAGLAGRSEKGVYDLFRNRLIIPIRDERGRVVSLAGRAMADDQQPKYLNGPETAIFSKSRLLFAYDREMCRDQVVIVEGYMDAMQAWQAGFKNVVAQMGTALTNAHLKLLRGSKSIVLALDGDKAGQQAAARNIEPLVKSERDVYVMTLPADHDPDDIIRQSPQQWRDLVSSAEPVADYIIRTGCESLPENASLPQRVELVKRLIPPLMACESDIYKMWNVQSLAARLRLPVDQVLMMATGHVPEKWAEDEAPRIELVGIETAVIRALVAQPGLYDGIRRSFRQVQAPPPEAEDFPTFGDVYEMFTDAIGQFDVEPIAYLESCLDADQWAIVSQPSDTKPDDVLELMYQLRLSRLIAEVDYLLTTDDLTTAKAKLAEKSRIEFR